MKIVIAILIITLAVMDNPRWKLELNKRFSRIAIRKGGRL
jgi:hypothetical protein